MTDEVHNYGPELRKMSLARLQKWMTGWKVGSYPRIAGEQELARRQQAGASVRGWIAIGISIVSLGFSIWALLR